MKKRGSYLTGVLALLVSFSLFSKESGVSFGSYGYFRTGATLYQDNVPEHCFRAPGASTKFRLGNECDTYLDVSFTAKVNVADDFAVTAAVGWDFYSLEGERPDYVGNDERFIKVSNKNNGQSYWAGRRTYRRDDIHMTDFEYMFVNGDGFGIENIDVDGSKLGYGFLRNKEAVFFGQQEYTQQLHYLSLAAIPLRFVGNNTEAKVEVFNSNLQGRMDSYGLYLHLHSQGYKNQSQRLILQYGQRLFGQMDTLLYQHSYQEHEYQEVRSRRMLRLLGEYVAFDDIHHALVLMAGYQRAQSISTKVDWFNSGFRYKYYYSDHINWLAEAGLDHVKDKTISRAGNLVKLTAGLQWAVAKGLYARPVIRTLLSYAHWSNSFASEVNDIASNTDIEGFRATVQYEHWW